MRKMLFAKLNLNSNEWLALGKMLFGKSFGETKTIGYGEPVFALLAGCQIRFYCSTCDRDFASVVTPTVCHHCRRKADDDPQALTMTHRSTSGGTHTGKVFPFFAPEQEQA